MKKLLYISVVALLAACGSGEKKENKSAELQKLEAQRAKLKEQQAELSAQLSDLDEKIAAAGGEVSAANKSALVNTQKLSIRPFDHYFEIQGTLEADKSISITPEIPGVVKKIYVQEGQNVSVGQTILELDKELIDQQIATTKESLELAKFVYEKQEKLWKQNIGSELQFRQAKLNYESAQTGLKSLQTQRSKTVITAPYSGRVEKIYPKIGEMAAPGMPFVTIVNLDQLKVNANVSEGYVGKVKQGSNVTVNFPSLGKDYSARVVKVGSSINPTGRTFEISAAISNGGRDLLPNMVAKVKIRDYNNDMAVVVPAQAILQDINGNSFVYLVTKGKELPVVKKHQIKTGLTYNNETEVISGLRGDEEIVIEGVRSINDGDKISIAKK